MLAMYLAVLDDQSSEEQFKDVYTVSYTHLDVYKRQFDAWSKQVIS